MTEDGMRPFKGKHDHCHGLGYVVDFELGRLLDWLRSRGKNGKAVNYIKGVGSDLCVLRTVYSLLVAQGATVGGTNDEEAEVNEHDG